MADRANLFQATYQSIEKKASEANPNLTESQRTQLLHIFYVLIIGLSGLIISAGVYLWLYWQTQAWQLLGAVGLMGAGLLLVVFDFYFLVKGNVYTPGYLLMLALIVIYGGFSFIWANSTLYTGIGGAVLIVLIGSLVLPGRWFTIAGSLLLFGLVVATANIWQPFAQYDVNESPFLRIYILAITGGIALLVLWQIIRALITGTIRTRLLISFVVITLLPLAFIGTLSGISGRQGVERQVLSQLDSVATLKEAEIETWLNSLQNDIAITVAGTGIRQLLISVLTPENTEATDPEELAENLRDRFRQTIGATAQFEELFLISKEGDILLSTDELQEGKSVTNELYFQEASKGVNYTQAPTFFPSIGRTTIIAVRPLFNIQGRVMGMVAGRANMNRLNAIMFERTGLGNTGETYLIGQNHVLLTNSRFAGYPSGATYVRSEAANTVLDNQTSGQGTYENYRGDIVLGDYRWIRNLNVGLVAEQSQAEAFSANEGTLQIALGATLGAAILAVGAAFLITRSIANPLGSLTETATQIAAGDLTLTASVQQKDEIGTLAVAFNSMTTQIRELVNTLEHRVLERTQALATSTEVSRQLSTILDQSELVSEVVTRVQTAFNYYHAHIYLVDAQSKNLIMVGGTGKAGQQMLNEGHTITSGKGLVGRTAETNLPILVPDVSQEAGWLPNPLLPDTKAEVAVPIAIGDEVLGVLDVQHNLVDGLQDTDVDLLQSIANQVAIALRNARLYSEIQAQVAYQAAVAAINQKILGTQDIQNALQVAVREIGRATNTSRVTIRLGTDVVANGHSSNQPDNGHHE